MFVWGLRFMVYSGFRVCLGSSGGGFDCCRAVTAVSLLRTNTIIPS